MNNEPNEFSTSFTRRVLSLVNDRQNRGRAAALRRGLSSQTKHYAYPVVLSLGGRLTKDGYPNPVDLTVAALIATHPMNREDGGNFGRVCKQLREGHESFDARFRRLLACERRKDACDHLRGFVLAAKQKSIKIDYARLHTDLTNWHWESVRLQWAETYWGAERGEAEILTEAESEA